ncbi:MAG: hypothetical protein A2010_09415 [Nitrospirae bacterium GWD2_57_9]|nr:MAG: hypothetical protein A2010_09415 [Nitrospirae bacterium GWD2_57_9]OGW48218.1 MAG: hypothetical protein A2078_08550 [Nitrospirae bacterium GWC2_57_9]
MAQNRTITKETPPEVIERDIAETRTELSRTIGEIQERFSAAHFKAEVKEIIRGKVDYAKARGKELAGRAKDSAMKLNRAARKSSQEAKKGLLRSIEKDPSAARVIAFEAGALLVMIGQRLMKRKAATPSHVLPEQKITLEEAQEKVKAAALAPEEKLKKAA